MEIMDSTLQTFDSKNLISSIKNVDIESRKEGRSYLIMVFW